MPETEPKIRLVLAKVGLDPHDRGAMVLSRILREAGMEIIFLGRFQTPEGVVQAAIQEDADVIALSDHCGVMVEIATDVIAAAKKLNAEDIPIVTGGFIPETDVPKLEALGVSGNFTFGVKHEVMIEHIRDIARTRAAARA